LKDDILNALQSERTLQELYQLFPERSTPSIRGTVNKLVYDGVVQRIGEGKYKLTSTDTHKAESATRTATPTADTTDSRTAEETETKTETDAKEVEQEDREPGRTRTRTDLNQVLIGALEKFAGGEGIGEEGELTSTSKTRPRTRGVVLPDFDEARQILEPEGYTFHENFNTGIGTPDVLINSASTFAVARWDDPLPEGIPEGDIYRLPDQLVKSGNLARASWVSLGSSAVNLLPLFDCLKALGKRNNESLRKNLRFFHKEDGLCFAYILGNRILFVMVKSNDTSIPAHDLVRV